jgi:DNA-binding transcriptional ArsR family regulator/uncharacterized protein YndB with AHSA1/START domain
VPAYQVDSWSALGDRTRRTIFERVARRPCAVSELARGLPVSRPAVSQHLKVLKEAGLVTDRPAGNRRIYSVNHNGLSKLRTELDQFWADALAAYKTAVEQKRTGESMTAPAEATVVRHEIVVNVPIERAFSFFTEGFGSFKPPAHNLLAVEIAETVFEPRVGGHLYDRGIDGSECHWARVLAYDRPHRVVISWDISPTWQIETNPGKTSEVEVRFIAEAPERTRVELEHRNLDRHGEGWEAVRAGVDGDEGWPLYLQRFGELLTA